MTTLIRNPRVREGLGNFVLVFLSVGIVILYSSYQRPIWIDEFLRFRTGAWPLEVVLQRFGSAFWFEGTDSWTNFSGSGFVHTLLHTAALNAFGASYLSLRLVGYIAALTLLICSAMIIRNLGFSVVWQVAVIFALGASQFLMSYAGEALTYMPMASTIVAMFFYQIVCYRRQPNGWETAFGWITLVVGAALHTYFFMYFLMFVFFFSVVCPWLEDKEVSLTSVRRRINWRMLIAGGILWILFNFRGWLSTRRYIGTDVFEFIEPEGGFLVVLVDSHWQMLPMPKWVSPFFFILFILLVFVLLWTWNSAAGRLRIALSSWLAPLFLIVFSLLLSALVSLASYLNGYWIVNRQWLASIALVVVATVWFLASVSTAKLNWRFDRTVRVLISLSVVVICLMAIYRFDGQLRGLRDALEQAEGRIALYKALPTQDPQGIRQLLGDVGAADANLLLGGRVWSVF